MSIKKKVDNIYFSIVRLHRKMCVFKSNRKHFKLLKKYSISIKKLSSSQKNEIDKVYKKFGYNYSYKTHQLCYSINGCFDPYIMPEDLFRTKIELKLNDVDYKNFFTNKNYFETFMPNVKFPVTIIRNINGIYYDSNFNVIDINKVIRILGSYDKVVFKPSVESGFGKSVKLMELNECIDLIKNNKNAKDFLIQELLHQHKFLSNLNASSVNIIRIVTLFLNNEVHVVTSAIRIGGEGSFTDNYSTPDGRGMIIIGLDLNGKLKNTGYFSSGQATDVTSNGVKFGGMKVPKYNEMVDIAIQGASKFPNIKFIGWDFTLDDKGNIIVMEYNAKSPGVLYYQYCNGSLFGNLTEKLLEYVKEK